MFTEEVTSEVSLDDLIASNKEIQVDTESDEEALNLDFTGGD